MLSLADIFARNVAAIHLRHAGIVLAATGADRIIIYHPPYWPYDSSTAKVAPGNTRYTIDTAGRVYALSEAAQRSFVTAEDYLQFIPPSRSVYIEAGAVFYTGMGNVPVCTVTPPQKAEPKGKKPDKSPDGGQSSAQA